MSYKNCRIVYSETNPSEIISVLDDNGNDSILFIESLIAFDNDQTNALNVWATAHTDGFKEVIDSIPIDKIERYSNGEPKLKYVLNYINSNTLEVEPLTNELYISIISKLKISQFEDVDSFVKSAKENLYSKKDSIFTISRKGLENMNSFFDKSEIEYILKTKKAQKSLKSNIESFITAYEKDTLFDNILFEDNNSVLKQQTDFIIHSLRVDDRKTEASNLFEPRSIFTEFIEQTVDTVDVNEFEEVLQSDESLYQLAEQYFKTPEFTETKNKTFDIVSNEGSSNSFRTRIGNTSIYFNWQIDKDTNSPTGDIVLSLIETDFEKRGKGDGSKALKEFLKYTDSINTKVWLKINPTEEGSEYGLDENQLKDFYVRNGFETTSYNNKIMYRNVGGINTNIADKNNKVLLAPNGKPTNLTPQQYYQVRTQEFKNWFGDWENDPQNASKVVDENGEPLVVYHGTKSKFTIFDNNKTNYGGISLGYNFFTNKENSYPDSASDYAGENGSIISGFVNIKNPLTFNDIADYYNTVSFFDDNHTYIKKAYINGKYDGIIIQDKSKNIDTSILYAFENPNQIKSATENNGNFSEYNNDIRFQIIGEKGALNVNELAQSLSYAKSLLEQGVPILKIEEQTGWYKSNEGWKMISKEILKDFSIKENTPNTILTLKQVLGNENILFKTYPTLQEYSVVFIDTTKSNVPVKTPENFKEIVGSVDRENSLIRINTNAQGYKEDEKGYGKNILGHEVMHIIQGIEGFSVGGNLQSVLKEAVKIIKTDINEATDLAVLIRDLENFNTNGLTENEKRIIKDSIKTLDAIINNDLGTLITQYKHIMGEIDARLVSELLKVQAQLPSVELKYNEALQAFANFDKISLDKVYMLRNGEIRFQASKKDSPKQKQLPEQVLNTIVDKIVEGDTVKEYYILSNEQINKNIEEIQKGNNIDDSLNFNVEDNFKRWKGNNELLEGSDIQGAKTGQPIVVKAYHGTTNEFYEFDSSVKGNIEGHLGRVNYFTSDYYDANQNYLSNGADITSRVDNIKERLLSELEYRVEEDLEEDEREDKIREVVSDLYPDFDTSSLDYNMALFEVADRVSSQLLLGGTEQVLDLFIKLNNPVVLGNGSTWFETLNISEEDLEIASQEIADENDITIEEVKQDYEWDIKSRAIDNTGYENLHIEALREALQDNGYDSSLATEILGDNYYESEVDLNQIEKDLRKARLYENYNGEMASSQVISDFFKKLGFDGIILTDVSERFKNMGLHEGVSHIHVFDEFSNQIKLADGSNITFDSNNPDIRFQIIGEKGASRLENATIVMRDLQIAQEMKKSGKDALSIKNATGWERAPYNNKEEGKWMYELPNIQFKLDEVQLNKEYTLNELLSYETNFYDKAYGVENSPKIIFKDIEAENKKIVENNEKYNRNESPIQPNTGGFFESSTNTITVFPTNTLGNVFKIDRLLTPETNNVEYEQPTSKLQSRELQFIAHELTHAVQRQENFYRGGNINTTQREAFRLANVNETDSRETAIGKIRNTIQQTTDRNELDILNFGLKALTTKGGYKSAVEAYSRISGEVLARAIEDRVLKNNSEKLNSLIQDDYEFPIEQQLFIGGDNTNPNFQIVGEKGVTNLESAVVLLENLKVAKQMQQENKDAKTIKLSTGWEFNKVEKKWKTEIEDGQIKSDLINNNFKKRYDTIFGNNVEYTTLDTIYSNDELFKAYPQLKEVEVSLYNTEEDLFSKLDLFYLPNKNTIYINKDQLIKRTENEQSQGAGNSADVTANTLRDISHEIHHIISVIEGFETGSNLYKSEQIIRERVQSYRDETQRNVSVTGRDLYFDRAIERIYNELLNKRVDRDGNDILRSPKSNLSIDVLAPIFARRFYFYTAGEVEARNVEKRINMPTEERARLLLSETEDVSEEDKIYLDNAINGNLEAKQEPPLLQIIGENKAQKSVESVIKGYTYNNKVYINKDYYTPDTLIHEPAHIYLDKLKTQKTKLYEYGISLINDEKNKTTILKDIIKYVKDNQPNLIENSEQYNNEILSELIGRRGQEILLKHKNSKIAQWINDFISFIKDLLGLSQYSNEQVLNMSLKEYADAIALDIMKGNQVKTIQKNIKSLTDEEINQTTERILNGQSVFKRFSQKEHRGLIAGGKHHVQATLLINRLRESSKKDSTEWEAQAEKVLEKYAKENNIWIDINNYGEPSAIGAESYVWFNENSNIVTKAIGGLVQNGLDRVLDKITIHNALFPATKIEVIGFTKDNNGNFNIVVEQPLIKGNASNSAEIRNYIKELGFQESEDYDLAEISYSNNDLILSDLHLGNVIKTENGNLAVIDGVFYLNSVDEGYGSTRVLDNSIEDNEEEQQQIISYIDYKIQQAIQRNNNLPLNLAPNGNPSILFKSYKDLGYNDAQAEELVSKVYSDEFISWFGESKVVDKNGQPMLMFHGSPYGGITAFNRMNNPKLNKSGIKEFGTYFSSKKELASAYKDWNSLSDEVIDSINKEIRQWERFRDNSRNNKDYNNANNNIERLNKEKYGMVYPVFLSLSNIFEFDADGDENIEAWNKLEVKASYKWAKNRDAMEFLKEGKYGVDKVDGVIARNIVDAFIQGDTILRDKFMGDAVLVFDGNENQIKSATENIGTFDKNNNDIRFQVVNKNINTEPKLPLIQTNTSLYNISSNFDNVRNIKIGADGEVINVTDKDVFEEYLIVQDDNIDSGIVKNITELVLMPQYIWETDYEFVREYIELIEQKAIKIGVDVVGISNEPKAKVLNVLSKLAKVITSRYDSQAVDNLYNEIGTNENASYTVKKIDSKFKGQNLVTLAISDNQLNNEHTNYDLFDKFNLLRIDKNIFLQVDKENSIQDIEQLYREVYKKNIDKYENVEQLKDEIRENEVNEVDLSTASNTNVENIEKYILFNKYFGITKLNNNNTSDYKREIERYAKLYRSIFKDIESKNDQEDYITYLKTDFKFDIYQDYLQSKFESVHNTLKDVDFSTFDNFYKYLDFSNPNKVNIKEHTDLFTIEKIKDILYDSNLIYNSSDIINYFKLYNIPVIRQNIEIYIDDATDIENVLKENISLLPQTKNVEINRISENTIATNVMKGTNFLNINNELYSKIASNVGTENSGYKDIFVKSLSDEAKSGYTTSLIKDKSKKNKRNNLSYNQTITISKKDSERLDNELTCKE